MKKKIDLPQVSEVVLPEVFTLRPGVYILILLIILLAAAIFFITIFPGILKGGRYVTFEAPLAESGITINDTYLGGSSHQYFIESGSHTITYSKAGIAYAEKTIEVDHPIFLTKFIHRTMTVSAPELTLSQSEADAIIRFTLHEIADASAILDWDLVNRYAPLYQNLATDLAALRYSDAEAATLLALSYITTREMYEDALVGFKETDSQAIASAFDRIEPLFSEQVQQSAAAEKPDSVVVYPDQLLNSPYFSISGTGYGPTVASLGKAVPIRYPAVNEAPETVTIERSFVLANEPVTLYQWAHFLEANPFWASNNREALIVDGLVDPFYLKGLAPSTLFVTRRPVTNISFFSAEAFCAWLSEVSGKEVFLPTEAMYSVAAHSHPNLQFTFALTATASEDGAPGGLLGGVWEMTQSPFIPLSRLLEGEEIRTLHTHFGLRTDPIVVGGSYLNDPAEISLHSVGVISPHACADQIGLRIAWYE